MVNKRKVLLILLFALIIIIGGVILLVNNMAKDTKQEVTIKTDKEVISSRFPNVGEFIKCYWKADVIGKKNNGRVPGPSAYWMKGFIEIDGEKINSYIERYNMKRIDENIQFDFYPENFDIKTAKWFFSNEFNDFIKPPSFFGKFYIDSINKVIYFDVRK